MVKGSNIIMLICLLVLNSCSQKADKKIFSKEFEINTHEFSQSQYEKNVLQFLKRQKIDIEKPKDVIFLNSSTCKSCILQVLMSLEPFLSKTENKTFLFVNDSIMIQSVNIKKNSKVRFLYYERDIYERNHVIHNAPYLYHILNKKTTSIKLDTQIVDSLNLIH